MSKVDTSCRFMKEALISLTASNDFELVWNCWSSATILPRQQVCETVTERNRHSASRSVQITSMFYEKVML